MNNELQTTEEQHIEVMQVSNAESLAALTRSEIDVQIATAKQYPRNLARVLGNIETLATMDEEVAGSCFYTLRRQGKVIEGPSVRRAEIIASSWGNLRVQARIIGNDGKMITAQGVCHDLESNYAVSLEVKRRITDKHGKTFSEDMQVVTGNAACAIAMRNALFKVVPAALVKKVIDKAKKVSLGESMTLETSRAKMLQYFKTIGVEEKQILDYLSIEKVDEINIDMVVELRGLANAIKEGTTTAKEAFEPKIDAKKAADVAQKFAGFVDVEEIKEKNDNPNENQ
jgi:CRISPR/Cas system-associated exonuclease Cas4 (RecB family)